MKGLESESTLPTKLINKLHQKSINPLPSFNQTMQSKVVANIINREKIQYLMNNQIYKSDQQDFIPVVDTLNLT